MTLTLSFYNFLYCKFGNFREGFIMRSFMKIKYSQIGKITLSVTGVSESRPCWEFLSSQICVLRLFPKIKFSWKFQNLQYFDSDTDKA